MRLKNSQIFRRLLTDRVLTLWMLITLAVILCLPLFMGFGLYLKSMPLLENHSLWGLISSLEWAPSRGAFGFWPFVAGSLYVTLIAFLLSAPVCMLAALFLTQFSGRSLMRIMQPVIDILAGLPSVIYGVWGILIVVPVVSDSIAPVFGRSSTGYSILAGGIVLAIMCIPYMLNMLMEVFLTVPTGLKEASLSLGATYWESVKHVVLRKSLPGIISAFGLSIAKAFGETIAVMMVVGNTIQVRFSPLEAGYPLPALIANNYGEMLSIPMYDSALMFASLLLLAIVMIINMIFRLLIYRTREK